MINTQNKILGIVINTYDALNYDIDFPYIDRMSYHEKLLQHVISNQYSYKNIMKNGELSNELTSFSYRCRLNGIEINSKLYNKKKIKLYTYEIKKLLDRVDLYIHVEFKGVDIYNRLLINISIPELKINLSEYLLTSNIFNKYHSKNKKLNYP